MTLREVLQKKKAALPESPPVRRFGRQWNFLRRKKIAEKILS